jgi:hypothetical protein
MKTKVFYLATKLAVAVIIVVLIAFKATAADAPKLKFITHSADRAIIAIDNSANEMAVLTIENANGDILYYKEGNINEKVYSKVFSFKNLTTGGYKVSVKTRNGENTLNFNVVDGEVKVKTEKIAPFIEVNDNVIKLSYLNHSLAPVEIILSNEEGDIYSKQLGNDFNINAGFNIASLKNGNYVVNVSNGDNTFSYNFIK